MRLPEFDPSWNRQCLACRNVMQEVQEGVRILRCSKARIVGGGGKRRGEMRMYCIEVMDDDCKKYGWFESEADNG